MNVYNMGYNGKICNVVWAVFVLEGKTSIAFWTYLTPQELKNL